MSEAPSRSAPPAPFAASPVQGEEKDVFLRDLPADLPLHRPMASTMKVDLFINRNAQVLVAHDRPFPGILQWAEYDVDIGNIIFVTNEGRIQDMGMKIQPTMRKYLRMAQKIDTVLVQDGQIRDVWNVPLVVRETGI